MSDDTKSPRSIGNMLRSLPVRVAALLSIALLPIGMLAIWQTTSLTDLAESRRNLTMIALTDLAVSDETRRVERAVGAITVLGSIIAQRGPTADDCGPSFQEFLQEDADYISASYIDSSGAILCRAGQTVAARLSPSRTADIAGLTGPAIFKPDTPDGSTTANATVYYPLTTATGDTGFVALTFVMHGNQSAVAAADRPVPDTVLFYNTTGQVLTETINRGAYENAAPAAAVPAPQPGSAPQAFVSKTIDGNERVFVTFPMVPNLSYAVASWSAQSGLYEVKELSLPPATLPFLMWLATILVAYFAMHRLVLRHIRRLRKRMREFASTRHVPPDTIDPSSPLEIQNLEMTFTDMAYDLADDEAQLENSLREKNVLLKEVHHRVKNNLQMISSIMNMQIRATADETHKAGLTRLQDRVVGLATVHRHLYESKDLGRSDAAVILRRLFEHLFNSLTCKSNDIKMELDLAEITLLPDQAVPMTLLAGELGTNALKHMSLAKHDRHLLRVTLRALPDNRAELCCYNTTAGADPAAPHDAVGFGIGQQLIRAFATQLGSRPVIEEGDGYYQVKVEFRVVQDIQDQLDY